MENSQSLRIILHAFGSLQIIHLIALATLPCRQQYTIVKHDSNHLFIRQKIQKGAWNKRVLTTLFKFIIKKENPWSLWALKYTHTHTHTKLFSKGMRNNDTRGPTQLNSYRGMSLNEEDAERLRYFSHFPIHTSMLFSSFTFFSQPSCTLKPKVKERKWKKELWWTAPFY